MRKGNKGSTEPIKYSVTRPLRFAMVLETCGAAIHHRGWAAPPSSRAFAMSLCRQRGGSGKG